MSQAGKFLKGIPIESLTGNFGGPITPDSLSNINIVGLGFLYVTGDLLTHTLLIASSSRAPEQFTTNAGIAIADLINHNLNVFGAHGINTAGATDTITIAVDNTLVLGDLAPVLGTTLAISSGNVSIDAGNLLLPATLSNSQGVISVATLPFIHSFGTGNTFVGSNAGNFAVTGTNLCALGAQSLDAVTTGSSNTAIGTNSLSSVLTGSNNIGVGYESGNSYIGAESNNIVIGSTGVAAESGVIRIGTPATHTSAFFAGIDGVNVGSVAKVVTEDSNKLGTATITGGVGIVVTPTANTITLSYSGALNYTPVNTTPYVVISTDTYISVDCTGSAITVKLPDAATLHTLYIVKDRLGGAAAKNITITTVTGATLIDGATSFVMNTNYQAINIIGNGTSYELY